MLRQKLENDLNAAMKAREPFAVSVLRMLRAAVKNEDIEKRAAIDDDGIVAVIGREAKKLKDALGQFRAGGRQDLVEKTEMEIALMETYLPARLDDEEVRGIVTKVISELGAVTQKDFGRVMSAVMKESKGRADGATVSAAVKEALKG